MELSVVAQSGIPEDAVLSIRAGTLRRQALVSSGRTFKFPKLGMEENPLKFDIMKTVATAYLCVKPGEDQYKIRFNSGGQPMSCEVALNKLDGDAMAMAQKEEKAAAGESNSAVSAKEAKDYLESHKILPFVQAVLQTVIRERPANPWEYIARHFRSGFDHSEERASRPPAPASKEDLKPAQQPEARAEEDKLAPVAEADTAKQEVLGNSAPPTGITQPQGPMHGNSQAPTERAEPLPTDAAGVEDKAKQPAALPEVSPADAAAPDKAAVPRDQELITRCADVPPTDAQGTLQAAAVDTAAKAVAEGSIQTPPGPQAPPLVSAEPPEAAAPELQPVEATSVPPPSTTSLAQAEPSAAQAQVSTTAAVEPSNSSSQVEQDRSRASDTAQAEAATERDLGVAVSQKEDPAPTQSLVSEKGTKDQEQIGQQTAEEAALPAIEPASVSTTAVPDASLGQGFATQAVAPASSDVRDAAEPPIVAPTVEPPIAAPTPAAPPEPQVAATIPKVEPQAVGTPPAVEPSSAAAPTPADPQQVAAATRDVPDKQAELLAAPVPPPLPPASLPTPEPPSAPDPATATSEPTSVGTPAIKEVEATPATQMAEQPTAPETPATKEVTGAPTTAIEEQTTVPETPVTKESTAAPTALTAEREAVPETGLAKEVTAPAGSAAADAPVEVAAPTQPPVAPVPPAFPQGEPAPPAPPVLPDAPAPPVLPDAPAPPVTPAAPPLAPPLPSAPNAPELLPPASAPPIAPVPPTTPLTPDAPSPPAGPAESQAEPAPPPMPQAMREEPPSVPAAPATSSQPGPPTSAALAEPVDSSATTAAPAEPVVAVTADANTSPVDLS